MNNMDSLPFYDDDPAFASPLDNDEFMLLEDRKRRHEHNSNKRQEGQIDLDVAFLTVMGFAEEERRKEQLKNACDQLTQEEVQRALDFIDEQKCLLR